MNIKELYEKRKDIAEEKEYLSSYNLNQYFRPSVSSDIAAFTLQNKSEANYRKEEETCLMLLLVKRGAHPFKGDWALPGGFMREDESIEECAYREIVEETNIEPISMKSVGVFSECNRDPRGRIISNAFASIIYDGAREPASGEDAEDVKWFEITLEGKGTSYSMKLKADGVELSATLKEVRNEFGVRRFEIAESDGIAFDHAAIIGTALFSLRRDVQDFDILFDFLPEKFTLLSLQKVQEAILNRSIQPANFRRKIAPFVEETQEYVTGAGHRPAKLYIRKQRNYEGTESLQNNQKKERNGV